MKNDTTTTATAEAPDTSLEETGYMDADAALAAELGLPGEEDGEATQTTPDEDAEGNRDSDDVETAPEDGEGDEEEEQSDSEEESDADEADEEEEEDAAESGDLFNSIPKAHHSTVGKLISLAKQKERAKSEARIAELAEQAERAQKLPDLEAQLESVKAQKVVPAPSFESPYANVFDAAELDSVQAQLWDLKQQLATDPDNYMVPDSKEAGGKRYATEAEVRQAQALVDRRLLHDLPARKQWLQRHGEQEQALKAAHPDIDDPKSELHRAVNRVVSELPALKTIPGYRAKAASQVLGQLLVEAKGKDAYSYVKRLLDAKANGGKAPAQKAVKRAPKPTRSTTPPRRAVSTSAGRGGFNEEAFEAEILGGFAQ